MMAWQLAMYLGCASFVTMHRSLYPMSQLFDILDRALDGSAGGNMWRAVFRGEHWEILRRERYQTHEGTHPH